MKNAPRVKAEKFRLYGIFGKPLSHTLSPAMHEAAFRDLGLKAFYLPFELPHGEFLRLMKKKNGLLLDGFNVTVPYKEEILPFVIPDPSARAIGAVNTVVNKKGRWAGFNTDAGGFLAALQEKRFSVRGKKILILGAGGSARAVVYALAKAGAREIILINRMLGKAEKIILRYRKMFPGVKWQCLPLKAGALKEKNMDLVVNTTSVGLKKGDKPLLAPEEFGRKTFFMDLVYNPVETALLRRARRSGHRTLNGLGMLVNQGAEAFRLWTGQRPSLRVMRKAVTSGLP